ncbi:MAG: hypothetical protein HYR55_01415 [Acidobacteria bacterium]|nr:hypothetical protein [Acidobacteriota bacterium]MBI3656016.1 hypothetical protein [Acidobacteriota bacterium]
MENREGIDRRRKPTNPLSLASLRYARRRSKRRDSDKSGYADQYNPKLLLPVLAIMVLCSFDGVATLLHINKEVASEANPLMAYLINLSPMKFFFIKYFSTFLGVLILVVHHWFPRIRRVLWGIVIAYLILGLFHVAIIYYHW